MTHPEVIAHRGAPAHAPENTMEAFALAVRVGAGCVEPDLHPTKDGVLICLHDRTLERTTNVREKFPGRARDVLEGNRVVEPPGIPRLSRDRLAALRSPRVKAAVSRSGF